MDWASGGRLLAKVLEAIPGQSMGAIYEICDAFDEFDLLCWDEIFDDFPLVEQWARDTHPEWEWDDE